MTKTYESFGPPWCDFEQQHMCLRLEASSPRAEDLDALYRVNNGCGVSSNLRYYERQTWIRAKTIHTLHGPCCSEDSSSAMRTPKRSFSKASPIIAEVFLTFKWKVFSKWVLEPALGALWGRFFRLASWLCVRLGLPHREAAGMSDMVDLDLEE